LAGGPWVAAGERERSAVARDWDPETAEFLKVIVRMPPSGGLRTMEEDVPASQM
jgi:hypothetical protein